MYRLEPDSLRVFNFSSGDPSWDPSADKRVLRHAVTVVSAIGMAATGLKDLDAMAVTLRRVGKSHHGLRVEKRIFGAMGDALQAC